MKSSLPFTSVVSYHTDEYGCGVARFSKQLAARLGVPFMDVPATGTDWGACPLFSLKWGEIVAAEGDDQYTRDRLVRWTREIFWNYGVFWHDAGSPGLTTNAKVVFYADPSLGPNGLFCPSMIKTAPPRPVKLFSFGMAHKCRVELYARVAHLLDLDGIPFHLRVSVGLHEGTSLSEAHSKFDALKETLGPDRVTILGILSDEAVAIELRDCDSVLAFFEKGARANNTTLHAALEAHKPVVTNHDAQTPGFLKAATRDIATLRSWHNYIPYHYSWDNLIEKMTEIYAASVEHRQQTHR